MARVGADAAVPLEVAGQATVAADPSDGAVRLAAMAYNLRRTVTLLNSAAA